jgi:hypothetical protein
LAKCLLSDQLTVGSIELMRYREWVVVIVHTILTFLPKNEIREGYGKNAMKLEMTNFQSVAENLVPEGEVCDLAPAKLLMQTEADTEIAPLVQKIGSTSVAEIDRLMAELQLAREFLQSEGERVEQETVRYANLAQAASVTTKIILDAVSQWHPAYNQQKTSNASEVTAPSTENNIA